MAVQGAWPGAAKHSIGEVATLAEDYFRARWSRYPDVTSLAARRSQERTPAHVTSPATAVGQVQTRHATLGTVPRRKRGDGSSDGASQPSRAPAKVGVLVAVSGAVLLRMIGWFLRDNVLVAGVRLVEPGWAGIAMVIAPGGIVVGRVMIDTQPRKASWRSPGPLLVSLAGAGALVFVIVVGMGSYPTDTRAVLVGLDPSTGKVAWRTITPVTARPRPPPRRRGRQPPAAGFRRLADAATLVGGRFGRRRVQAGA